MLTLQRDLKGMHASFKSIGGAQAFDLYLRLHALWDPKSDPLDFLVMARIDDDFQMPAHQHVIAEADSVSAHEVVEALEKEQQRVEKIDVSKGGVSSFDGASVGTGALSYSQANIDRVQQVMLSPEHAAIKKLIMHIVRDAAVKQRELKIIRLVCLAEAEKCGGVFSDSPKASLEMKAAHELAYGAGTYPPLTPVVMLRQMVFANRRVPRM